MMQACVIAMSLLIPQVFGANLPSPNATASPIPMPEDFTGYQVGIWAREQRNRQEGNELGDKGDCEAKSKADLIQLRQTQFFHFFSLVTSS